MRRAGLIAAVAIGVAALGAAAAWFIAFRDEAEPVSVEEAVTSFRTETEPTGPGPASPIPGGVYVYATRGFEKTDALTGVTHRYPRRTTITVAAHACGASLTWRVLEGRSTEWVYCLTTDGWKLRSQTERHTFFGRTETTRYVCADTPILPATGRPVRWGVSCATGSARERGTGTVVADLRLRIGGRSVGARHVRKRSRFFGEIRGDSTHDLWFHHLTHVPVRIVMASQTTNSSPIGDVHYEEEVTLQLTSLAPRR